METDESGGVRVKGGPDGLEVFEIFGGDERGFAENAKCDVIEDSGDEEVGKDVAHGDDVGDEIDHRAVWVPAVLRRARVHAFGFVRLLYGQAI